MTAPNMVNPTVMPVNEVLMGDCLDRMRELPDSSVDLIVTDPPYNIKKDTWDDIEGYEDWLQTVLLECQRVLKDNGSFYMFHNDMLVLADLISWLNRDTNFVFRQLIVWNKRFKGSPNKGFLDGYVEVDGLRNYQKMAEYIIYCTFQDEAGRMKRDRCAVYPVRDYIRSEIIRAKGKISPAEINKALGTATNGGGVASAILSLEKRDPSMITREHYTRLREWLNEGQEYEYLRQEYEDLRFTFNNQKTHHSVWNYDVEPKKGHITPKPIALIRNILRHSSNEGDIVLDCFLGSGTTAVACQQLKRQFIGIERSESYVEIAQRRLAQKSLLEVQ